MEKDREFRYQSATELKVDLQRLRRDSAGAESVFAGRDERTENLTEHKAPIAGPQQSIETSNPRQKRQGLLVGVGVAILVVLALALWWRLRNGHAEILGGEVSSTTQREVRVIGSGNLTVRSNIAGADILVDGQSRGTTAKDGTVKIELVTGDHAVQIKQAGYQDSSQQAVQIVSGQETPISLNLVASEAPARVDTSLVVRSEPGAEVRVDGVASGVVAGDGSLSVRVEPGERRVRSI